MVNAELEIRTEHFSSTEKIPVEIGCRGLFRDSFQGGDYKMNLELAQGSMPGRTERGQARQREQDRDVIDTTECVYVGA